MGCELGCQLKLLQAQNKSISEPEKQTIILEYKALTELTEAMLGEYNKGYQFTKSKIKEVGYDTVLLSFFEDEEDEFEDDQAPSP